MVSLTKIALFLAIAATTQQSLAGVSPASQNKNGGGGGGNVPATTTNAPAATTPVATSPNTGGGNTPKANDKGGNTPSGGDKGGSAPGGNNNAGGDKPGDNGSGTNNGGGDKPGDNGGGNNNGGGDKPGDNGGGDNNGNKPDGGDKGETPGGGDKPDGGAPGGGGGDNNGKGNQPSTGAVIGDPHLRSLDGATFEFMKKGTFSLVDSAAGLKVQSYMATCGQDKKSSCTTTTAIGYQGSVLRFIENKGKITVAKGSSKVGALTVHQAQGNSNGFRVHINDDPSSYIDLNIAEWHGESFLDTTCVLSAKMKKGNKGILGDGDGNQKNDNKDADKLAKLYTIKGDNLLTCKDCSGVAGKAKEIKAAKKNEWTTQGYKVLDASKIPVQSAKKRMLREAGSAKQSATTPYDAKKVEALCKKIIGKVPHCGDVVQLKDFYIKNVCIQDTKLTKDMNNIDHAKLAYLRQCRRAMDMQLTNNNNSAMQQKRSELTFGTNEVCPKQCNKNGKCLIVGCECNKGFTGLGCEEKLW